MCIAFLWGVGPCPVDVVLPWQKGRHRGRRCPFQAGRRAADKGIRGVLQAFASRRPKLEQETGFEGLQVHEPKTKEEAQEEASCKDKEPIGGPDGAQRGLEHGLYGRCAVRWKEDKGVQCDGRLQP